MAERHAFVCGHPVGHSRSPLIHGHWLAQHGIDGTYRAIDVGPVEFRGFLRSLAARGLVGGNITIPHKQAALALADEVDEAARRIGAVNTVWLEDGRLYGSNTDWTGFAANMDEQAPGWDRATRAVVLGAGGAARGILYALEMRNVENVTLVNRTEARAAALAGDFPHTVARTGSWESLTRALDGADLVINTTSVGMEGGGDAVIGLAPVARNAVISDIVYVPLETPLLAEARRRSLRCVDGLGMLLHQAVPGFARWFGVTPEVTGELRRLVLDDIGHKS